MDEDIPSGGPAIGGAVARRFARGGADALLAAPAQGVGSTDAGSAAA